jgi:hypothetical protein
MMTSLLYKEHPAQKKCYVNKREMEIKFDLFLLFFQNSTVYDLWNCCVTFDPQ